MSYDESDAAWDAMYDAFRESARDDFYEELYDEIVRDFATSRLQAFYESNPLLAHAPLEALSEARALQAEHPSAAVVFAATGMEVGLRTVLLKPLVYGLVHAESSAPLIMELAVAHKDESLLKALVKILATHGGVDLQTFKRVDSSKTLWEEMKEVRNCRNRVVHRAEKTTPREAAQAIEVAEAILKDLFPAVVGKLGLHLHEGFRICGVTKCNDPRL